MARFRAIPKLFFGASFTLLIIIIVVKQQRTQTARSHDKKRSFPFFYNLYIPDDPRMWILVEDIVTEQFISLSKHNATNYRIMITVIGPPEGINTVNVLQICRELKLDCSIEQEFRKGAEEKTLDFVRSYCQNHTDETVIYAHDKGSQHDRDGWNVFLRRFLLKAITSSACQNMPNYCSACGASYSPLPYAAYHGNMWVAKCDYISKLLTVDHLSNQLYAIRAKYQREGTTTGIKLVNVGPEDKIREYDSLPAGRAAAEHWIATHPEFRPCDIYDGIGKMPSWNIQNTPRDDNWPIDLKAAPRYPLGDWVLEGTNLSAMNYVWQATLEKKAIQWNELYQADPGKDSWVLKYYADPHVVEWLNRWFPTFGEPHIEIGR